MVQIKITWKAFGEKVEQGRFITSVEIEVPDVVKTAMTDEQMCEHLYQQTNLYKGPLWDQIQPKLAESRTHTALSVGDEIEIDGIAYEVADFGFEKVA